MTKEEQAIYLNGIAGVAKVAAISVEQGKYWPGELSEAIRTIYEYLDKLKYIVDKH